MSKLRGLTKLPYESRVDSVVTKEHHKERDDLTNSLIANPCLAYYEPNLRCYLSTYFPSRVFVYALKQPSRDTNFFATMNREISSGICDFLDEKSKAKFLPVAFGSRRARGDECKLHSHLGEGFYGDWAINKNRACLWTNRFTWITDCYALRSILTYDMPNPVLLRLQMRIMLWSVDIVH